MKFLLLTLVFVTSSFAEEISNSQETPKEAILAKLLTIRDSPEELAKAISEARELKVPELSILEARFLYLVDQHDTASIAALSLEFEKISGNFSLNDSEIFTTKEDFLAVVEFTKALDFLIKNDNENFKQHIKEAFWLSPSQSPAFKPYIEQLRISELIKVTMIDVKQKLYSLENKEEIVLESLFTKNKPLLLLFWSPWGIECETTLSEITDITKKISVDTINFTSIVVDSKNDTIFEAKKFISDPKNHFGKTNIADVKVNSLAAQLRVTNLPTVVLLSPEGKILFHGEPSDKKFETTLRSLKNN
jgi:thioredoxin-related protein